MRSALILALLCCLAALAGTTTGAGSPVAGTGPAPGDAPLRGLHGNHVSGDAQVTADGTVVVETFFIITDGYLVIHADGGDEPGRVLGHVPVTKGFHRNVEVPVADSTWAENDTVTVWAVLHGDDGDGEFEPEEDDALRAFGQVAADTFPVRRGTAPAYVVARDFTAQRTPAPRATIRRAALPERGFLVVRTVTDTGDPGRVVGTRALDAGVYENVTVPIDADFFENGSAAKSLTVAIYPDDGDDSFADDEPLAVGGRAIRTRFAIRRVNGTVVTTDSGVDVNTPVPTTSSTSTEGTTTGSTGGSGGPTPGPGPVATLGVLAAVLLLGIRRSHRKR